MFFVTIKTISINQSITALTSFFCDKTLKMTGGTPEVRSVKINLIDFWHLTFDLIDFLHFTFDLVDF